MCNVIILDLLETEESPPKRPVTSAEGSASANDSTVVEGSAKYKYRHKYYRYPVGFWPNQENKVASY